MKKRNKQQDLLYLADAFYEELRRETRCEYGGWGLSDKRPFGNSFVQGDILEILQEPLKGNEYTESQIKYADELYDNLGVFLKSCWKEYLLLKGIEL